MRDESDDLGFHSEEPGVCGYDLGLLWILIFDIGRCIIPKGGILENKAAGNDPTVLQHIDISSL